MSDGWFCKIGDKKVGPLSVQQLKTIVARGQLRPEHLIRRGDEGPWVPAGRVKGLFPQPAGKPVARPMNLPRAQAAPQPPAPELPAEFALGSAGGHKHHVAMNVDKLDIHAEPVMVSTRKTRGLAGLKKGEQQRLTMILLGIIGGGLLIALLVLVIAASRGAFSSPPKKEETKKEETKPEEPDAKKTVKSEAKPVEKEDDQWTKFPQSIRRKKIEVKLDPPPVRSAPPTGSGVDATEHRLVMVVPVTLKLVRLDSLETIPYSGWGDSTRKNISLKDDAKTKYELLDVVEPKDAKAIGPGKPVHVQLIFEPPLRTATYLRLELPASAFDDQGMLKFQIPTDKVKAAEKKAPADEAGEAESKQPKKNKAKVKAGDGNQDGEATVEKSKSKKAGNKKKQQPAAEDAPDADVPAAPPKKPATKPADDDDDPRYQIGLPPGKEKPAAKKQGLEMDKEP